MNDNALLDWVEFVATKFVSSAEGWRYTRDTGDLKHIRYTFDSTRYDHWTKRFARAFNLRSLLGRDSLSKRLGFKPSWGGAWAHIRVNLRKDNHLPDGVVNGGNILTFWEEDGEYITLMGPTVGVRVVEFLRAQPTNPHAEAIMAEMRRVAEMSWPENG